MSAGKQWNAWEVRLRAFLDGPGLVQALQERQALGGHQDSRGRITYAKIANKDNFGAFRDAVVGLVPRASIARVPSLAYKLLHRSAWVYPKYLIQYTELDLSPGASLPTPSRSSRASLEDVLAALGSRPPHTPLVGICILDNEAAGLFHGTAFVAWHDGVRPHFAFYDPLAYRRGAVGYDYAANAFQAQRFETPVVFHDLSAHCVQRGDDFHCPQYVMDAEYCYVYSVYFLCKWIQEGRPTDVDGMARAVRACYVVDDAGALTRAQTKASMRYRVVMMGFLLFVLPRYLRSLTPRQKAILDGAEAHADGLDKFRRAWEEAHGFPLVPGT